MVTLNMDGTRSKLKKITNSRALSLLFYCHKMNKISERAKQKKKSVNINIDIIIYVYIEYLENNNKLM